MTNEQIITQHPYDMWIGSDGRYRTYLYDETKKYNRKLIAKTSKDALNKAIIEDYKKKHEERAKIYQVFEDWMSFAEEEETLTKNTIDRYTNDFDKFIRNTDFANKNISTVTEEDVLDFLKSIVTKKSKEKNKISKKCYSNIKIVVNGIFTYAKSEKKVKCVSVANALQNFRISDKYFKHTIRKDSEQVYNDEEIRLLSNYIVDMYLNNQYKETRELGILFIALTGLRIGELVTLKESDEDSGKLYIQRTETKRKNAQGKTEIYVKDYPKTVESMNGIELSDTALIVWNWIKEQNKKNDIRDEYLFYEQEFGRLHQYHFKRTLQRLCRECNIPFRSSHKLRKTYASMLFDNGVEEKIVQSQLRHKDFQTTHKHYLFSTRNREYMRNQLDKATVININDIEKRKSKAV